MQLKKLSKVNKLSFVLQSGLHACRQQLQKLSWECEDAVKR